MKRFLIAALAVVLIATMVPLVAYGTVSPCELLRKQMARQALEELRRTGAGMETVGATFAVGLAGQMTAVMTPVECARALWRSRPDRGTYVAEMSADLRNLSVQQDLFFSLLGRYAGSTYELADFVASPGVDIDLSVSGSGKGWIAVATHEKLRGRQYCVMSRGDTVAAIRRAFGRTESVPPGEVYCAQ